MFIIDNNYDGFFDRIASKAFDVLGLDGDAYLEIVFASEQEIRQVNNSCRGVDSVTDVLSFPYIDEIKCFTQENYPFAFIEECAAVEIGSIMICEIRAREQAAEYGHTYERELGYLFLHGLLHVLGYDHRIDSEKAEMRQLEEEILLKLGITRI